MASPYLDAGMSGSVQQAQGYLNQQAKQRGRGPLSDDEWNTIGQKVNYTGGNVSGQQVNQAIDYLGWGSPQQGPNPPPQQNTPPAPVDPTPQAPAPQPNDTGGIQQFQGWAKSTFGREASPQELQQIASDPRVGYQGGPLSPQQLQAAQQVATELAQRMGWKPAVAAPPPAKTLTQSVEQGIQQRIDQPIGFNPDDPIFKGQTAAFQRASDRDTARKRGALAERAAARGTLNAGGFDVDTERILTEQGQNEQAFETQLAGQELQSQRDQVMRALELGAGRLSDTERNQLAERLAQLDAALRKAGLALNAQLGNRGLDIQSRGQDLNNQQFYDNLGANIGLNQANLNQNALLSLLNG